MTDQVYLLPGSLYACVAPCVITTLVASSVAVTMWSPRRKIGGMNHFMLPRAAGSERSPRDGETALAMLLARMQVLGCAPGDVEARIFGGASVSIDCGLGAQNLLEAWQFARDHALHVVDEHAGGDVARRLALDLQTGHVDVLTLRCSAGLR